MTKELSVEDAIEVFKFMKRDVLEESKEDKVLDIGIKALEQQTREDCIRREAVSRLICQNNDKYGYSDRFHEFTEKCLQLPSVTPQPKIGRWINDKCDKCGASRPPLFDNYCPNCGAKMQEVQE